MTTPASGWPRSSRTVPRSSACATEAIWVMRGRRAAAGASCANAANGHTMPAMNTSTAAGRLVKRRVIVLHLKPLRGRDREIDVLRHRLARRLVRDLDFQPVVSRREAQEGHLKCARYRAAVGQEIRRKRLPVHLLRLSL